MSLKTHLQKNFFTGLLVLLPLWITFVIILIFTRWVSNIARPVVVGVSIYFLGIENEIFIRAISFFVSMFIIYTIGLLANNFFGKKIIVKLEEMLKNVPVINDIYNSSKKLVNFIFHYNTYQGNKIVLVEYPRKDVYSFGIVTVEQETSDKIGVFIPTTPNPTTGMFVFVKKDEVKNTNLNIEEALKIIVSGGVIKSDDLTKFL
jgi:uncharacterized membrane protein